MNEKAKQLLTVSWLLVSAVVLIIGFYLFAGGGTPTGEVASSHQARVTSNSTAVPGELNSKQVATRPIEKLRVGDRVMAFNPEVTEAERSRWKEPDWESWVKLTLLMSKPDGSELKIQMLRSEEWVMNQLGLVVGKSDGHDAGSDRSAENVKSPQKINSNPENKSQTSTNTESPGIPLSPVRPLFRQLAIATSLIDYVGSEAGFRLLGLTIQMDLHELGLTGKALVVDIEACSSIRSGNGQVVTATFHHSSGDVIDLVVADEIDRGEHDTIGTTKNHPFWSVDRHEYVQAGSLRKGEHLRTIHGETKRVVNKLARPGPEAVFNLEVFGEHTYYVGKDGVLVHNSDKYASDDTLRFERLPDLLEEHGIVTLKGQSLILHGTSSRNIQQMGGSFIAPEGKKFFGAIDFKTAMLFGQRNIAKSGGGDLVGSAIILDGRTFKTLQDRGNILIKPVDDMPDLTELIFDVNAVDVLREDGIWIDLSAEFFLK